MRVTLQKVQTAIDEFSNKYWKPKALRLKVGKPYCLFPDRLKSLPKDLTGKWPDPWPNGSRKGIYLVLNKKRRLLYVGKASMNSAIGIRLSHWFPGTSLCIVKGKWTEDPFFFSTVPVPEETPFQAAALEEFLIGKFDPPDNTNGVRIRHDK